MAVQQWPPMGHSQSSCKTAPISFVVYGCVLFI